MYLNPSYYIKTIFTVNHISGILVLLLMINSVMGSVDRFINVRNLPAMCDFINKNNNLTNENIFENLICDESKNISPEKLDIKTFLENPKFETYLNEVESEILLSPNCEDFKKSAIQFKKDLIKLYSSEYKNRIYSDQIDSNSKIFNNQEISKVEKLWDKMTCIVKNDCDIPSILIKIMNKSNNSEYNNTSTKIKTVKFNNISSKRVKSNNLCQYKEYTIEDKILWLRKALTEARRQKIDLSENSDVKNYMTLLATRLALKYKSNGKYKRSRGFIHWTVFPYIYKYFIEDATKIGILKEYAETLDHDRFFSYYCGDLYCPDILDYVDFNKYLESIEDSINNKTCAEYKNIVNYIIKSLEHVLENDYYSEKQKEILKRLVEKMKLMKDELRFH